jgi:serine/threonine-protein kinase
VNTFDSKNLPQEEVRFAELMTRLADEMDAGAEVSLPEVCAKYPQYESRLRELWGTLIVTRAAGSFSTSMLEFDNELSQSLPLPCDFGDYVIESEIGRGGMGVVFKATRKADQHPVAIKMILNGEYASATQRERFFAEGKVVENLQHPNIVPILEIGEFKETPFICMEYIEGTTLTELIESERLKEEEICQLSIKLCDAVQFAHQQGILHRDIKPSNILVRKSGDPLLLDFGLAKQLSVSLSEDLTRSGAILGTPAYMSPEQASGTRDRVSEATDVYALGSVLYFMATGQAPFSGQTIVDVLFQVLEQEPISPRSLNPEISRGMEHVILRCMEKARDQRYATAQSLADDLTAVLEHQPVGQLGLKQQLSRVMRDTHHASLLDNWGIIWIWNSVIMLFAGVTMHMNYSVGYDDQRDYLVTWAAKLVLWAVVFWLLRRRMGPVTFVERQLAHVWAACFAFMVVISVMESAMDLKPLTLAPLWAVACGMAFFINAGMLSGAFYIHAIALLLCSALMLAVPNYAALMFGLTTSGCFLLSGVKYYRRSNLSTGG